MKISWRRLSSLSSEDVFKTSSKCLDQDKYIHLTHTSSRRLQDVLIKTNVIVLIICLQDVFKTSSRSFQDVFKMSCKNFFKTSSRSLQDVLQKRLQDSFKASSRRFQDVFKTFSRLIQDVLKTSCKDLFKTFSRRMIKLNCSC